MICFPNAKINLGLRVTEKRPDGYHNLETVFYPIGLKDALEAVPAQNERSYSLTLSGLSELDEGMDLERNMVTKAYRILEQHYPMRPVSLYLRKAIPTGAGLGGGSSDAAHALRLLANFNQLSLDDAILESFSAQIGADCAFFIKNKPIFARGIGTEFENLPLDLSGWFLVLVNPDIHVSTAEAYALVRPALPDRSLYGQVLQPLESWKDDVVNDFEPSVFDRHPRIATLKETLYREGAVYASMSGSGSSVYGLFREPVRLQRCFPDCQYWSETLELKI